MAYKTVYKPLNESKYVGDSTNIICRSLWERRVCKYLDTNENVINWGSEEIAIPYISPLDNRRHSYFRDSIVRIRENNADVKTNVIEVKPFKQTKKHERGKKRKATYANECATYVVNQAKWRAAEDFCSKKNWEFLVLTEKEIF